MSGSGSRLLQIDALRGAAALGVVLFHLAGEAHFSNSAIARALAPLSLGYAGVFLFFVISGFCIHLRCAGDIALGNPPNVPFLPFWKRRFWRLYPAYFVALGLSVLVASLVVNPHPRPSAYDLLLHVALLQNLDPHTTWKINGVFWTLAIEEQLYLAYFLLLPLRRRLGWARSLVLLAALRVGWFALGMILHRVGQIEIAVGESAVVHWFAWALGAWSVEGYVGLVALPRWTRDLRFGTLFFLVAMSGRLAVRLGSPGNFAQDLAWLLEHPTWALGFFVVLNRVLPTRSDAPSHRSDGAILRGLASLGIVSYSLYLTHQLTFARIDPRIWSSYPPDAIMGPLLLLLVFVVTAVVAAWAYFMLFERPFMSGGALRRSSG